MFRHPNTSGRKSWRILLALLCVVLVMASATVELTHSHASGSHHPDCSLCATAHVAIQAAPIAALLVFFAAAPAVVRTAQMRRRLHPTIFALFTRPPPACLAAI